MRKEFVSPGHFHCNLLRQLKENVWCKHPVKWQNNSWALHHDNTAGHTSLLVRQLLTSTKTSSIPHPPYSPDLTPCNFFLFPEKLILKWRHLEGIEEIQAKSQDVMKILTQNDFQKCF
jgi:hypothetical protein